MRWPEIIFKSTPRARRSPATARHPPSRCGEETRLDGDLAQRDLDAAQVGLHDGQQVGQGAGPVRDWSCAPRRSGSRGCRSAAAPRPVRREPRRRWRDRGRPWSEAAARRASAEAAALHGPARWKRPGGRCSSGRPPVRMALNSVSCPRGDRRTSSVASEGFRLPLASRAWYSGRRLSRAVRSVMRCGALPIRAASSSTVQPVVSISE